MSFKNVQTSQQVSPHHHNMRWMKKLLMHEGGAEHEATWWNLKNLKQYNSFIESVGEKQVYKYNNKHSQQHHFYTSTNSLNING